ncbi:MAG: pentapeptide repeat-containing protein [Desulfobacteraceae bacterium]|nr:pentapeptide repeat-containing protein [Desulfobacteraceae bacterium]
MEKMIKFKKDRNLLCFIILIVTAFSYPALAQGQVKKKKFNKTQYEMLKRCSDKKDMTEWTQWREKNKDVEIWLKGAWLNNANLQGVELGKANLQGANLWDAKLQGAELWKAKLQGAMLWGAKLQGADLGNANLQGAKLWDAKLQGVKLNNAKLQGADLRGADLARAVFEVRPKSLPNLPEMALANNLSLLTYIDSPHALVELRKGFKKAGLRKQEREITYAIKRSGFKNAMLEGSLGAKIKGKLGWFFFDLTCKWGMSPQRPLLIFAALIFICSIFYLNELVIDVSKENKDGIWKIWIPERVRDDLGRDVVVQDVSGNKVCKQLITSDHVPLKIYWTGLHFSILSAFHIGWRDLNAGGWIYKIIPHEYRLAASGRARIISCIQSLISVYLLALSILTYFGRPFESY